MFVWHHAIILNFSKQFRLYQLQDNIHVIQHFQVKLDYLFVIFIFARESRRKHVQLIKDRKVFDSKISEMEERTNEMMIAKFGRIVDLEKLETITVNRQIEELKEKLRLTEIQCAEELEEWDVSKIFI